MKLTEHLLFLALMIPTILMLVVAAVLIAEPAHPASVLKPQAAVSLPDRARPVDERGFEGPY